MVLFVWEVVKIFTVIKKNSTEYDENLKTNISQSVNVYTVRDDKNGYPHFLIYENGEWKYVSAKHFEP